MRYESWRGWLWWLCWFWLAPSLAATLAWQDVSTSFHYRVAAEQQQLAVTVLEQGRVEGFRPMQPSRLLRARAGERIWLLARLEPPARNGRQVLELPPFLAGRVEAWVTWPEGVREHYPPGFSAWHAAPGVAIPLLREGAATVLIAVHATPALNFSALLWQEDAFESHLFDTWGWLGVMAGGVLVLMLFNLVLSITLRERFYVFHLGYVLSLLAAILLFSGIPAHFDSSEARRGVMLGLGSLAAWFGVRFIHHFFAVRQRWPRLSRTAEYMTTAGVLLALLLATDNRYLPGRITLAMLQAIFIASAAYYWLTGMREWLKGRREARYLVLSMTVLLAMLVVHVLYVYGVLSYGWLPYHALEVGVLVEGLLMSIALSDRIRLLAEDKARLDLQYRKLQEDFTRDLMRVRSQDRRRYATILHDRVGHGLLVLKQGLQRLPAEVDAKAVAVMSRQCIEVLDEVRQLSSSIHPHVARHLGLEQALQSVLEKALDASGVAWKFNREPLSLTVDGETRVLLYRMVQEAVSNILRHAQATEVTLVLKQEGQGVLLEIADNGRGFDPQTQPRGLGLEMMRNHVRLQEGRLEVSARPGAGTRLVIWLPCGRGEGAAA